MIVGPVGLGQLQTASRIHAYMVVGLIGGRLPPTQGSHSTRVQQISDGL